MKTARNQILKMAAVFAAIFAFAAVFAQSSYAQDKTFVYENVSVTAVLNQDSTMDVTEEITYRFKGEFRGVFREITLEDEADMERCKSNPQLQCGGFEFLIVEDVLDGQNNSLKGKYKEFDIGGGSQKRHRVEWKFSPGGTQFNNETFKWTIKYKILGAPGYFEDYDLLYWNALFEDRAEPVENFTFDIKFPKDFSHSNENLRVFGTNLKYVTGYNPADRTLSITSGNISPFSDFTVLYKFPKGVIDEYARINLSLDPGKQNVSFGSFELKEVKGRLYGIPPGEETFEFSKKGYHPKEITLSLRPGEIKELSVVLEPTFLTKTIKVLIVAGNILLCLFIPVFIYFLYAWWQRKGRDRGGRKTIVPWFEPPDNIPPYLLGSLKDEKVDLVDITSSIVDLAYRGFIKIKELGQKKVTGYELIKRRDFESSELTPTEKMLLRSLLDGREKVSTNDLKNRFYMKLNGIKDGIYDEMVQKGYFDRRPDRVRAKYLGFGIAGLLLACASFFVAAVVQLYTLPLALGIAGMGIVVISFFMPSKTPKGTEIFEQAKGFRMYLHTAERFRLQKLTPRTFEKFLSYAMVFNVEKEWAAKFKDIYKKMPDWYEARPGSTFNTIYFADSLSRFNSSAASTMKSVPSSSGSSGGGWSGGGGFGGGFSGGGGGGGGGGAW